MDADGLQFIANIVNREILGGSVDIDDLSAEDYWAGKAHVPLMIRPEIETFLTSGDREALIRASHWIARSYVLAGTRPNHHISLVRWLLENGRVEVSDLAELLALESISSIDEPGRQIALIARELLDEDRPGDAEWTIVPMLLAYSPSF